MQLIRRILFSLAGLWIIASTGYLTFCCFSQSPFSQISALLYCAVTMVMSLSALAMYGWDKQMAIRGRHRIRERTLHLLALLGGWPGAVFASHLFRHKTQKAVFRTILVLTTLAHVLLVCGWFWAVLRDTSTAQ